ncbi:MAG: hypothetical protein MJB14_17865 [Spirochaetes bacterium]|nr:hypothetical protein [Spirochaetota bacterium]
MRFGEFLLAKDVISQEQLDKAISVQASSQLRIGEICVNLGFLSKKNLEDYLEIFHNH